MSRPDETPEDEHQELSHSLTLPIFLALVRLCCWSYRRAATDPLNRTTNSVQNFQFTRCAGALPARFSFLRSQPAYGILEQK